MFSRRSIRTLFLAALFLPPLALAQPAAAQSHGPRIVRLSQVDGDVRYTREFHGDPLSDSSAVWDSALLNLPVRQGYALATGNGRAEVEFENGAMAFLAENSVLEFYDLSLQDGAFTTRLVLRQGTAEFYVNPRSDDYFSVTGGDFTAEARERTTFRFDNFDDGSSVSILQGRAAILNGGNSTDIEKGQSFSMTAGDASSGAFGRVPDADELDRWVSGRIEAVQTASVAAQTYSNEASYVPGYADLYTYGSWYPIAGYGPCWRPFGVDAAWFPFGFGGWILDPVFGWLFVGNQPWGWLPFHYGGWIFEPGIGWVWTPGGSLWWGRRPRPWRPVTAVFVHTADARGLVPMHPKDSGSRTPLNLTHGVYPVSAAAVSSQIAQPGGENWKIEKSPARDLLTSEAVMSTRPTRTTQTLLGGGRAAALRPAPGSGISYDARERRYVNASGSGAGRPAGAAASNTGGKSAEPNPAQQASPTASGSTVVTGATATGPAGLVPPARTPAVPPAAERAASAGAAARGAAQPPRAVMPPPAARETRTPPAPTPSSHAPSWDRGSGGCGASEGARPSSAPAARPAPSAPAARPH